VTHESRTTPAEDDLDSSFRKNAAECLCSFHKRGIGT
jgi:hypothetical protein